MAVGQTYAVAPGTAIQYFIPSGFSVPSIGVLNPNDGITYVARNRQASNSSVGAWDYKVPSQSYAVLPGLNWESVGIYYIDMSGSNTNGEITVYPLENKITTPIFQAIGRAQQTAGTTVDISAGNQPQNPPANTARLWVDNSGNLNLLSATGSNRTEVDSVNAPTYVNPLIGVYALGGDLNGTVANGHVGLRYGSAIQAYDSGGTLRSLLDDNGSSNLTRLWSLGGGFQFVGTGGGQLVYIDSSGNLYCTNASVGGSLTVTNGGTISNGLIVHNDIHTDRNNDTGVIYLGNSNGHYLYWDGTNYNLPNGGLNVGGNISGSQINGSAGSFTGPVTATEFAFSTGAYIIPSGNDLYYRSLGSGYHYFQNTGGAGGVLVAATGSFSSTVDVTTWIRCQNGTVYLTTLGGSVGIQVDNATNGNWNAYVPNGSGNFRIQHADGSWSGSQAANFQVQSDINAKTNIAIVPDDDCIRRIRIPGIPVITWSTISPMPNSPSGLDIGFSAQDMEAATPEAVAVDNDGSYFLAYGNLTAVLWGALRALDVQVQSIIAALPPGMRPPNIYVAS